MDQWSPMEFLWMQSHKKNSRYQWLLCVWKYSNFQLYLPGDSELRYKSIKKYPYAWSCVSLWPSAQYFPDGKVHGANMGPTWVLTAPGGPNVGPINFAIRVVHQLLQDVHHNTPVLYMLDAHQEEIMFLSNQRNRLNPNIIKAHYELNVFCIHNTNIYIYMDKCFRTMIQTKIVVAYNVDHPE